MFAVVAFGLNVLHTKVNENLRYLMALGMDFLLTLMICIMVLYPRWKLRQSLDCQRRMAKSRQKARSESCVSCGYAWEDIIVTDEGYESFANFLEKEFSIEVCTTIYSFLRGILLL